MSILRTDEYYGTGNVTPYYDGVTPYYDSVTSYYQASLDTTGFELTHSTSWAGDGTSTAHALPGEGVFPNRYELYAVVSAGTMRNTIRMFPTYHFTETVSSEGIVTALTPTGVWNANITYLLRYRPASTGDQ